MAASAPSVVAVVVNIAVFGPASNAARITSKHPRAKEVDALWFKIRHNMKVKPRDGEHSGIVYAMWCDHERKFSVSWSTYGGKVVEYDLRDESVLDFFQQAKFWDAGGCWPGKTRSECIHGETWSH